MMRSSRHIKNILAIFFLLMLGQKTGIGLSLHNIFHGKNYNQSSATPDNKTTNYSCNCIDDFTTPFAETDVVELPVIAASYFDLTSFYKESVPFTIHLFNSLRAPPAA